MKIFNLPDLGEGLPDAEIQEWHVTIGDKLNVDDIMVSMETAKASVDIPAPFSGRVAKLYGQPGDIIKTGEPLIGFEGEDATQAPQKDGGTVVGEIEVGEKELNESATGITPKKIEAKEIKATPAVRALAKKLQVDLDTVKSTNPRGHISSGDVKKAAQKQHPRFEALHSTRRAMAVNLANAYAQVVPITLVDDADIASWPEGADITIRVIRALTKAIAEEPNLNVHYDSTKMQRQFFSEVHLGLAVDSKDALYVPVLKDVANQTDDKLRHTIEQVKIQAQKGTFKTEELQGATFTLTNYGAIAGRYGTPMVVPPTVAILGIGKIHDAVVAHKHKPVIHGILPLSLTFDHRVVTGGEASRFLAAVIKHLQK